MSKAKTRQASERTFNLILALTASRSGLKKEQIFKTVQGYSERLEQGVSWDTLGRMFERDKEKLRALGVPLEVLPSPTEPENNQELLYKISKQSLEIPQDLNFDKEELLLLRAAALAWRETSLSEQSNQAIMKLLALDSEVDTEMLGTVPRAFMQSPTAKILHDAISAGVKVKFKYQKAMSAELEERKVSPFRLHFADTRWHLIGFDEIRKDWRIFLIERIQERVSVLRDQAVIEIEDHSEAVIKDLDSLLEKQQVLVGVRPNSEAASRLATKPGAQITAEGIQFGTSDYHSLGAELVVYGSDVFPISPKPLLEGYKDALKKIQSLHENQN